MMIALFQDEISEHQQLAEHYRELAAKREALAADLLVIAQEASGAIASLMSIKQKVSGQAIASLKSAVLNLFSDGDDGGNQPTDPTPDPDPTNPTGDDEEDEEESYFEEEHIGEEDEEGSVPCASCGADLNDDANYPEYAAAAITGICRDCEAKVIEAEKQEEDQEDTGEESLRFHPDNDRIAYTSDPDGKLNVWISFQKKAIAKSWLRFLEPMSIDAELREYSEGDCKWRIFLSGLSLGQVSKLAQQDFHWKYNPEIGSATPPESAKVFESKDVKIGYRVTQLLTPSEVFEVTTAVAADGTFFAKSVLNGDRQLFSLDDIDVIARPLLPGMPQYAKVLLPGDEFHGQKLPIISESASYLSLRLPNGQACSYRRDLCELCDGEIEAIADPTEPAEQQEEPAPDIHSILQTGDIVQVLSDRYPQFAGHTCTVTEITTGMPPILVRGVRGTKPYHRQELKLISKAPTEAKKELVGAGVEFDF